MLEFLTTMEGLGAVVSWGASIIFMLAILGLVWKFTPLVLEALHGRNEADKELASAIAGLKDTLNNNQVLCQMAQKEYQNALSHLCHKIQEIKDIDIRILRNVEAVRTTLKVREDDIKIKEVE